MSHRKPFDPEFLVALLHAQHPDKPELAAAMRECRTSIHETPGYMTFVNPARPNLPGSEWQFGGNVQLTDPMRGWIVLDVLKDGRIGGIEFVDEIPIETDERKLPG